MERERLRRRGARARKVVYGHGLAANIKNALAPGTQRMRELLGVPAHINSGYRSEALNEAVGGSLRGQHNMGLVADFTAPSFGDPLKTCRKILEHRREIAFDPLIFEGTWVHISFSPAPRDMVLRAAFTIWARSIRRGCQHDEPVLPARPDRGLGRQRGRRVLQGLNNIK